MKINILTQPLFCNYGGILQNFALQKTLIRMGHEVLTINTPPRYPTHLWNWKNIVHAVVNFWKRVNGCYQYPVLNPAKLKVLEHELSFPQREFVMKHIKKVDVKGPFTKDICTEYPADAWVVGSDQVWRPCYSPSVTNCFLDFTMGEKVRRIAYAASFGTDQWEVDAHTTEMLRQYAAMFDMVSVREFSGVKLCKDYLGIPAQHVLDPTMLLSAEDYLSIIGDEPFLVDAYIAEYVLDMDRDKEQAVLRETKRLGLPAYRVGKMHHDHFDSVERWLAMIAHSECVITDSFHGTVFSVIFRKPVKILTNQTRGNARLESLVATLGLVVGEDGFCRPSDNVVANIETLKIKSKRILSDALQ